ncbi:6534_t:CDS:2, partial [Funneliformis geosporum]
MRMLKPDLEVSMEQDDEQKSLDKNQIIEQGLIQELCGTLPLAPSADTCSPISSDDNTSSTNTNSSCNGSENMISDNLYKKTLRARKHLTLFGKNGVGIDKIKLVSYSATEISKLTNAQIQNVIDQVKKYISDHQYHMTLKTVPSGNDQIKDEMSTSANNEMSDPNVAVFWNEVDHERELNIARAEGMLQAVKETTGGVVNAIKTTNKIHQQNLLSLLPVGHNPTVGSKRTYPDEESTQPTPSNKKNHSGSSTALPTPPQSNFTPPSGSDEVSVIGSILPDGTALPTPPQSNFTPSSDSDKVRVPSQIGSILPDGTVLPKPPPQPNFIPESDSDE